MGRHDLNFTYVRSRAQGDLNIFDDFSATSEIRSCGRISSRSPTRTPRIDSCSEARSPSTRGPSRRSLKAGRGFHFPAVDERSELCWCTQPGWTFPARLGARFPHPARTPDLRVQHAGGCACLPSLRKRLPAGRPIKHRCPDLRVVLESSRAVHRTDVPDRHVKRATFRNAPPLPTPPRRAAERLLRSVRPRCRIARAALQACRFAGPLEQPDGTP